MFNVNGMKAVLIQNNRNESEYYDDQDKQKKNIKVCPYNVDQAIKFGIDTIPEATGYFIVKRNVDVKEGDQLSFYGKTYSVIKVADDFLWNKLANIVIAVK